MLKKFVEDNKHEEWFRPAAVIGILLILAIGVSIFDNIRSKFEENNTETEIVETAEERSSDETEEDTGNIVIEILYENKMHIILLICVTAALGVVQYKKKAELELKETNDK